MSYQDMVEQFEQELTGFPHMMYQAIGSLVNNADYAVGTTAAAVVYCQDKMRLLHYTPSANRQQEALHSVPVLIVYALINRYIMLDLEPGRSFVQTLLDQGLDVYLIDWGSPTGVDRYVNLGDYIDGYIHDVVEWICDASQIEQVNVMGICMGGTLSAIYTALHPESVKNLITFATPINCDIDDSALFLWVKELDIDRIINVYGNLPGDLSNMLYLLAVPVSSVDKYVRFFKRAEDAEYVSTFLRMEQWTYDSPDMAGEAFRQYIKDIVQKNLLFKSKLVINGKPVVLGNIRCPLLNVFGNRDHLVPPSSAKPLGDLVSSTDVTNREVHSGHIGMFVGKHAQKTVVPEVARWITARG